MTSRLRARHLLTAAEALHAVLTTPRAADAILQDLYRQRGNMGARDRAQVSELVYGALRGWFPVLAALGWRAAALEICVGALLQSRALSTEGLPPLRELAYDALVQRLRSPADSTAASRLNLPEWMHEKLLAQFGDETSALAAALNQPGTVDLRVNTLKGSRDGAIASLKLQGIEAAPVAGVPAALRLAKRVPLQTTEAFRSGLVEPQDVGSQHLARFVEAQPGETVVDFCAGAGGKTLALGALMQDRGTLWALDVDRSRLARLEPRLARSGLSIVQRHVLAADGDPKLAELAGSADAVLVDAPCSGTGTWRRNPELRLRAPDLARLAAQQHAILDAAAKLVRPGGRLVYATCSVLREENEAIVEGFLARYAGWQRNDELRLLPHRNGTDGFYAARLVAPVH